MRLFVALRLDVDTMNAIEALQAALRAADRHHQVRWVEPGGIHLTFKFLGEVPEPRVPAIVAALRAAVAGRSAPRTSLTGVGGFPDLRRPRVIWLGVTEEGEALAGLNQAIEGAVEPLGWERERRAFQPHLTLGRVKDPPGGRSRPPEPSLVRALASAQPPSVASRIQDRVALVRSHLSPSGARYEDLQVWRLAPS